MRIAIMQPYLFPYIGYFQLVKAVDKFILFDDVNYINKGWVNRNRILVNYNEYLFTVPLKGASQNKLINEIDIDESPKWRNKLLKTIEHSYAKAPYFSEVNEMVKDIIDNTEGNLSTYILYSINRMAEFLDVKTLIVPTSRQYQNQSLRGEERIIDICVQENAKEYVNPIGGMEMYTRQKFDEKGIKLFFLKTRDITYKQYDRPFVPSLSMLDILMFCSREEIKGMLEKCELV